MNELRDKTLGFFLTRGLSLDIWNKKGLLDREVVFYNELAAHFKRVVLFSYGTKNDYLYKEKFVANVQIIHRPRWAPSFIYSFILPLVRWGSFRSIDILKTNQMDGAWVAVIAKKLFNIPLVVRCGYEWLFTLRSQKKSFLKIWFAIFVERFVYKNANKIILTSRASIDFVHQEFSVPYQKMIFIPNYIATNTFKPLEGGQREKHVLFVGRLEKEKNIVTLVDAMEGIDASLVIVGSGSLQEEVERHAKEREVAIVFRGVLPQQELIIEMQKTAVFALPSLYEGSPKVLLEAMACGAPCIGTDVQGIREVLTSGSDGLLCGTGAQSLHEALSSLMNDQSLRESLGKNAREKILTTYSLEKILQSELSVYNAL